MTLDEAKAQLAALMPALRTARPPGSQDARARAAQAIAAADARLVIAKQRVSLAALACMRGAIDSAVQVRRALDEIEGARAQLAKAAAVEEDVSA